MHSPSHSPLHCLLPLRCSSFFIISNLIYFIVPFQLKITMREMDNKMGEQNDERSIKIEREREYEGNHRSLLMQKRKNKRQQWRFVKSSYFMRLNCCIKMFVVGRNGWCARCRHSTTKIRSKGGNFCTGQNENKIKTIYHFVEWEQSNGIQTSNVYSVS